MSPAPTGLLQISPDGRELAMVSGSGAWDTYMGPKSSGEALDERVFMPTCSEEHRM